MKTQKDPLREMLNSDDTVKRRIAISIIYDEVKEYTRQLMINAELTIEEKTFGKQNKKYFG